MITEYESEPIRGLPGLLPAGERILWQGAPDWRALARTAFHVRSVAGYFAALAGLALVTGSPTGAAATVGVGALGVALLHLLAWGSARTTVYTLTNRRIVLRIGIALPACINLPLDLVGAVDARLASDGSGDLPLTVTGQQRLGYLALWPHARPWQLSRPQPMLRAVSGAADVGALIARTCSAVSPENRITPAPVARGFAEAVAA